MMRRHHLLMLRRFAARRLRALHPFEVQANLMNACDRKCVYCNCPEVAVATLSTETWVEIIRRLGELGTIRIKFQGGEPTLFPGFRTLCDEAGKCGIIAAAISHGGPIAEDPSLLDGLQELVVSLDAPDREINDRLRGDGSYEAADRAVYLARERGVRTFVNMVVSQPTLDQIEPMLRYCEERGIMMHAQPIQFDRKTLYGRYTDASATELMLDEDQIRSMHQQMMEWSRQGRPLMFSSSAYEKVLGWPDFSVITKRSEGHSDCMAGRSYVHIEPGGDVHPCGLHSADFKAKNAVTDGLDEALLHARRHNCGDCWMVYLNERKKVFGLDPSALWQVLRRG